MIPESRERGMRVPPYLGSCGWYAAWIKAIGKGVSDEEAIAVANDICRMSGKDYARCRIASHPLDVTTSDIILLSVGIEGGAHQLKKAGAVARAYLSYHGNWPHIHAGALESIYGRMPYYPYLSPALIEVITGKCDSLFSFNRRVHSVVTRILDLPSLCGEYSESVRERGQEIAASLNPELSIVDALMKYGRESVSGLLQM